jgi:antagonist of KipI
MSQRPTSHKRTIEVLEPGFFTTVQDLGRPGLQRFGMPVSGAMDREALIYGNLLLGNAPGSAGLECTLLGPSLRFSSPAWFAVTGARCAPLLDGKPVPCWHACVAHKGSDLIIGPATAGARINVQVDGGIDVPFVMGSRATYTTARLGGYDGRPLGKGDVVPLLGESRDPPGALAEDRVVPPPFGWRPPEYDDQFAVRVILGPQDDHFTDEAIAVFLGSAYTVGNESDRMGYRLAGPALKHRVGADIVSDGIPLGAIQVPGHGLPIILMVDRQVTGGYAKIACVISADMPRLAQARPGSRVAFQAVSVKEAHAEARSRAREIEDFAKAVAGQRAQRMESARRFSVRVREHDYMVLVEPLE